MWRRTALAAAVTVGVLAPPVATGIALAADGDRGRWGQRYEWTGAGGIGCGDWHRMDYDGQGEAAREILNDIRDTPATDGQVNAMRSGLSRECEGVGGQWPNVDLGEMLVAVAVLVYADDPELLD